MTRRVPWRKKGLTLIEALLAAVVLSMAITAVTMPFTAGAQASAEDARATLAVNLAQDLMEEILAQPFRDPDGSNDGETSRTAWDDIIDYNGYVEAEGNIRSMGTELVTDPAATGLSRAVTVTDMYVDGRSDELAAFLNVTVEVRCRDRPLETLTRLVYGNR